MKVVISHVWAKNKKIETKLGKESKKKPNKGRGEGRGCVALAPSDEGVVHNPLSLYLSLSLSQPHTQFRLFPRPSN